MGGIASSLDGVGRLDRWSLRSGWSSVAACQHSRAVPGVQRHGDLRQRHPPLDRRRGPGARALPTVDRFRRGAVEYHVPEQHHDALGVRRPTWPPRGDPSNPLYDVAVESADVDNRGILQPAWTYQVYAGGAAADRWCRQPGSNRALLAGYTFTINPDQSVDAATTPEYVRRCSLIIQVDVWRDPFARWTTRRPTRTRLQSPTAWTRRRGAPDYGATAHAVLELCTGGSLTIDAASLCTGSDDFRHRLRRRNVLRGQGARVDAGGQLLRGRHAASGARRRPRVVVVPASSIRAPPPSR